MKKIIIIFSFLLSVFFAQAQQYWTEPEFPVASQALTVYFDATECDCSLLGYTGVLYAHTGVIMEGSTSWSHVIGAWGNNTNQPALTRISTDLYKLEITTSINSFYNITSGTVDKLAMVFRTADGTKQSSDIFIDVFQETSEITIIKPDSTQIFSINDSVEIKAVALFADSMTLKIENEVVFQINANSFSKKIKVLEAGNINYTIEATDGTETLEKTSYFYVKPDNQIAELPAGAQAGINYIDNTTVTLVLYAPNKKFVYAIGDFNNWEVSEDYIFNETSDGKYFWLTISNLTAQQEYAYQYFVDGIIKIADPFCDKILDPWNDQYIGSSVYPNLKPYPNGKTSGIVSVFQTAQTLYSWQVTDFSKPEKQDLVIYELLVREFTAKHDYQTLIDTIAYLKNLGVNAIELMPINEFEGNSSWGYNPAFYFAPDKYYGTKNKLKEFIDVCHQNEIAVIIDMVYNHSYGQSPLVQLYMNESWVVTSDNPWYNVTSPNPVYSWGYDFNHLSEATRYFVDRNLEYWLNEYKIDGFRFDFSKGFTNVSGDGWAYNTQRINILKHYADVIWNSSDGAYLILEHLCDNEEETVLANYGIMLWGNLNYNYAQAAMGHSNESDFSWISYKNRGWDNPHIVGYMESHDEERMMYRNLTYGNSNENYDVQDFNTAIERVKLAATFFFTVPGPKMIWQFGELGFDISIDDPCRICEKPPLWEYFEEESQRSLYEYFKILINLKKDLDVFETSDFTITANEDFKQIALNGSEMDMLVIGNFGIVSETETPLFPSTGTWYEFFSGVTVTGTSTPITLAPGEYRIYTTERLPAPVIAAAPLVNNVKLNGNIVFNDTLTAYYEYYDQNGDAEGETIIKWFRADNKYGANKIEITPTTSTYYIITDLDYEKYIGIEVTPVSQSEELTMGSTIKSTYVGPIDFSIEELTVFPNPFLDELSFLNIEDFDFITIVDGSGKTIEEFEVNNKKIITKNYYNLKAGVYIVVFDMQKANTIRIIKQ